MRLDAINGSIKSNAMVRTRSTESHIRSGLLAASVRADERIRETLGTEWNRPLLPWCWRGRVFSNRCCLFNDQHHVNVQQFDHFVRPLGLSGSRLLRC